MLMRRHDRRLNRHFGAQLVCALAAAKGERLAGAQKNEEEKNPNEMFHIRPLAIGRKSASVCNTLFRFVYAAGV